MGLDIDKLREHMQEVVSTMKTLLVQTENQSFQAFIDHGRPATYGWNKLKQDKA